jgi:4a-hydroxytetrahydrobiopterin dehydratase
MSQLAQYACTPVREAEPTVSPAEMAAFAPLVPGWEVVDQRKLRRRFEFDQPQQAVEFVERMNDHARRERHSPVLQADGDRAMVVECWTPAIDGLHPNDFIIAARADGVYRRLKGVGHEGDMVSDRPQPTLWEAPQFREVMRSRMFTGQPRSAADADLPAE